MSDYDVIPKPSYDELVAAGFRYVAEIQRLHAALEEIASLYHSELKDAQVAFQARIIARAALANEQET